MTPDHAALRRPMQPRDRRALVHTYRLANIQMQESHPWTS